MFQTKLDRWLIETFVYEHHILVFQLPDKLPAGVKKVKLQNASKTNYQYRLEISSAKTADKVIAKLKSDGRSFKTIVSERNHWYNWLINNKRKSFSFRVFWWITITIIAFFGTTALIRFTQTEKYADMKAQLERVLKASR